MNRYLVISYNPDEQQFHYDFILAANPRRAKENILKLRDYCENADVLTPADLTQMAGRIRKVSDKTIQNWIAELTAELSERNGEEPEPVKPTLDKQAKFQARLKACRIMQGGQTRNFGGIIRFDGLTAAAAQSLLDSGAANSDDAQNEAPEFAKMVAFLHANPSFTAHGYIVTPERDDERITIEGVYAKTAKPQEVKNYRSMFRSADEFDCTKGNYRAWYD